MIDIDDLLVNAAAFAATFDPRDPRHREPAPRVAVVSCMDARIDAYRLLGLAVGDAHVIRNAGGIVTDDAIRSLAISQRLLGSEQIMLIHHTDCGMLKFKDDEVKRRIEAETGIRPPFSLEAFSDVEDDVRQSMARIHASPFILNKEHVRGFVFEVETGHLRCVS